MRIRIQMRIRIHGVRNRPDKKSYTNFSWKCVFFFAFHGINLKGRNCSSDFNKNFFPNPLCLSTRSFMMRFACLPVCSWVRERANHATVCLGKEGSRSASLNPTASPPVLNRRPNSWIPVIKKAGNPAKYAAWSSLAEAVQYTFFCLQTLMCTCVVWRTKYRYDLVEILAKCFSPRTFFGSCTSEKLRISGTSLSDLPVRRQNQCTLCIPSRQNAWFRYLIIRNKKT